MTSPNETWVPPQVHGKQWTGPDASDLAADGETLTCRVPYERWPYGPPSAHETCCNLFRQGGSGGLYCDCCASDASDEEWGESP